METFAERLNSMIEGKRGVSAFARKCGLKDTTIRQYLQGAIPGLDKVVQIADRTGTSITWLATGAGPRDSLFNPSQDRTKEEHEEIPMLHVAPDAPSDSLIVIPKMEVRGSAGAGAISPAYPQIEAMVALSREFLRSIGVPAGSAQLLEVEGDSMSPTLNNGDVAVVDTSIDEVRTDAVYAVVYGGRVLIKRIQIGRDGSVTLSSDNKSAGYRDERIPSAELFDLHIAGRVKGRVGSL